MANWTSGSKFELIMEVWEKLDCEDVGRSEIESIRTVLDDTFGLTPHESPMKLARILADEGAVLRHSEILEFDVEVRVAADDLVDVAFEIETSSPSAALKSIEELTKRVRTLNSKGDSDRALRQNAIKTRDQLLANAKNPTKSESDRRDSNEIAEWLSIWLQSPDMFETWIEAKRKSATRGASE